MNLIDAQNSTNDSVQNSSWLCKHTCKLMYWFLTSSKYFFFLCSLRFHDSFVDAAQFIVTTTYTRAEFKAPHRGRVVDQARARHHETAHYGRTWGMWKGFHANCRWFFLVPLFSSPIYCVQILCIFTCKQSGASTISSIISAYSPHVLQWRS